MRFTCPRVELTKAVETVQHAIARPQSSILDCILFDCHEDEIVLRATDKTVSISTKLIASVQETGVAAIPARILSDILKKLPNMDATVSTVDESTAKLHCGASHISLNLQRADEFPSFPTVEADSSICIGQSQLRSMIDRVIFAVATTDDKPILTGVLFEVGGGRLTLAAIDGFRMAVREQEIIGSAEGSFVAPSGAIKEVARAMSDNAMDVEIAFDRNRARFTVGDTQILTQLLEGEYISYRSLFPKSFSIQVQVNREELIRTVERAIIMADSLENNVVRLQIQENSLCIRSGSDRGRMEESIVAITQGDDLDIAMNGRYLMDILKSIDEEEITLMFNTNTSPCAVEKRGVEYYGYLILPIQVG